MNTKVAFRLLLSGGVGLLMFGLLNAPAQSSSNAISSLILPSGLPVDAPANLSFGAAEVLKLWQSKVTPDTMLSFVQDSHIDYDLHATGIVYLRQQGVPDDVINAMLHRSNEAVGETRAVVARQMQAQRAEVYSRLAAEYALADARPGPEPLGYDFRDQAYTDQPLSYDSFDNDLGGNYPGLFYFPFPPGSSHFNRGERGEETTRGFGYDYLNFGAPEAGQNGYGYGNFGAPGIGLGVSPGQFGSPRGGRSHHSR